MDISDAAGLHFSRDMRLLASNCARVSQPILQKFLYKFNRGEEIIQSWSLRLLSYDKTGLRPASVLVLVLYF